MAEKTFIVKLAGDSKSYQSSMDQARKSLEQYQRANLSTGAAVKTMTSALSKYVSIAAVAKGATEVISRTLKGTNESADALAGVMHAAKVSVDAFFSSLNTGDFSAFALGLSTITQQAQAAYQALDRLGNASISWSYFQSARMADLTDLQAVVGDKERPLSERQAAYSGMKDIQEELNQYAQGYTKRALEALAKEMTAATNVEWGNVSRADLEKVLRLDLIDIGVSEESKQALSAQYKEYTAKLDALKKDFDRNYRKRGYQVTGMTMAGQTMGYYYDNTPAEDLARYESEVRALSASYQDAILYNETLVRQSDEWLRSLIQIVQQADNAERSLRRINNAVITAGNSLKPEGSGEPVIRGGYTGVTPGMAGLTVPEATMTISDKLPEIDTSLQGINGTLVQMQGNIDSVTVSADRMSQTFEGVNSIGRSIEYLGNAFSNLEKNGWKVAGGIVSTAGAVVQAYTQMAQAAAMAAATEGMAETPTVWGKLAAATALVTAIGTSFAQIVGIVNSTSFADGGIVPGQNYNDGITARVSSGEMIINEADQKRLFDDIHSGGKGGRITPASLTAEQLVFAINNWGRRTNRGELVFAGG